MSTRKPSSAKEFTSALAGGMLCLLAASTTSAQLVPERLYYGIGGRIEAVVSLPVPLPVPLPAQPEPLSAPPATPPSASPDSPPVAPANTEGAPSPAPAPDPAAASAESRPAPRPAVPAAKTSQKLEIVLRRHKGVVDRATVVLGRIDLAALFPRLWQNDKTSPPEVLFAQLEADGRGVGPAVVLQPLLAPEKAASTDPRGITVKFTPAGTAAYFSGIRAYVEQRAVLETSEGPIEIELRPDAAPNTAWNFRSLVGGGFYTQIPFHRVVAGDNPASGFVIQTGDPLGTGLGGPGYAIALERSTLPHDLGVLSMARLAAPDTGGSQFFICLSREACKPLDGGYAAFATVTRGIEVVQAIARVPVDPKDRPLDPPLIRSARLIDAPPRTCAIESTPTPERPAPDR